METHTFELMNGDNLKIDASSVDRDPDNPNMFHLYRSANKETALRFGVIFARAKIED